MKNSRGITLIALIITIIVMIILVAVTVQVALNGGIFDKASDASTSTAYEAEKEELLMYMFGEAYDDNNNKVDLAKLKDELDKDQEKWENITLDNATNPTKLEVTGKQSKKTHVIDAKGNITEKPAGGNSGSGGNTSGSKEDIIGTYKFGAYDEDVIKITADKVSYEYYGSTGTSVDEYDYTYDEDTQVIRVNSTYLDSVTNQEVPETITYKIYSIKDNAGNTINKVICCIDDDQKGESLYSTNGFTGFETMKLEDATYIRDGSNSRVVLETDTNGVGVIKEYFGTENNYDESPYIYVDGYLYPGWERYSVSSDFSQITSHDGEITYVKQS